MNRYGSNPTAGIFIILMHLLGANMAMAVPPQICATGVANAIEPYITPERQYVDGVAGEFSIYVQTGVVESDLTVYFTIGGSATPPDDNQVYILSCGISFQGSLYHDYTITAMPAPQPGGISPRFAIRIPANATSVRVAVIPELDTMCEGQEPPNDFETVTLALLPDPVQPPAEPSYTIGSCQAQAAEVKIYEGATAAFRLTPHSLGVAEGGSPASFEVARDCGYLKYPVDRWREESVFVYLSGTAFRDFDYTVTVNGTVIPGPLRAWPTCLPCPLNNAYSGVNVVIPAGVASTTVTIHALDDGVKDIGEVIYAGLDADRKDVVIGIADNGNWLVNCGFRTLVNPGGRPGYCGNRIIVNPNFCIRSSYLIQRATSPTGPFTTIATVPQTSDGIVGYEDSTVQLGIEYCYRVIALDDNGAPVDESPIECGTFQPPSVVTVSATTPLACTTPTPAAGNFRISRTGSTAQPLMVHLRLGGDAQPYMNSPPGGDYIHDFGSVVTIPANQSYVDIAIQAASTVEAGESKALVMKILDSPEFMYTIGTGSAIVEIRAACSGGCFPPAIATSPVHRTVDVGDNATFAVQVVGTGPFQYQWKLDDVDIPGATSASLTVFEVQPSHSGWYSVAVTGCGQTVNSGKAFLATTTVIEPIAPAIAVSGYTSFGLKSDRTVQAWGQNGNGQLGLGSTVSQALPVKVNVLSNVKQIAAGYSHALALKSDGTVRGWGYNAVGCVGDGTTQQRTKPVFVGGVNNVIELSAGLNFSLALGDDGCVWAWGYNNSGQLGNGTTTSSLTPVRTLNAPTFKAIHAGRSHALAIAFDGKVWAWGLNNVGQLGNGVMANSSLPVQVTQVSGMENVVAIAAGAGHSLALCANGKLFAWGLNSAGQLGDGSMTQSLIPKEILSQNVVRISAGENSSFASKTDGTLWAWGANGNGQLGIGSQAGVTSPTLVAAAPNNCVPISQIDGSYLSSAMLRTDGSVWAWGSGLLGDEAVSTLKTSPVQVGAGSITAGSYYVLARRYDGSLYGWGLNSSGQLGDGTYGSQPIPVPLPLLAGAGSVSAGIYDTLELRPDGTVRAWGASSSNPSVVSGLTSVRKIFVGATRGYAIKTNGTVWSWPFGGSPVQVTGLPPINDVAPGGWYMGGDFALALANSGEVWAWGENSSGQIGDGSYQYRSAPVSVLTGAKAIAAGAYYSVALKNDGTVYGWGANYDCTLGIGSSSGSQPSPLLTLFSSGGAKLAASVYGTVLIRNDCTAQAAGDNWAGALGAGPGVGPACSPVPTLLSGAVAVAAGKDDTFCALMADGSVYAWGIHYNGQVVVAYTPYRVEGLEYLSFNLLH